MCRSAVMWLINEDVDLGSRGDNVTMDTGIRNGV